MTAPDVFRRLVQALDAVGVPYMLTGSFASAYHAVPRATQDIDLIIAPNRAQLAELMHAFSAPEYYCDADAALEALERESLFNVIDLATGWKMRTPRGCSGVGATTWTCRTSSAGWSGSGWRSSWRRPGAWPGSSRRSG